ncbi:glycolate oxidase subunit GlcF [Iodidimonas sp. SYSU 1G8]|uniref:glycolate oxidase subunit GlcF n=1 Tax=Iodidimonas sp. SYSU 1G8 TaxID=3133967 RepID=UPI0031FE55E0
MRTLFSEDQLADPHVREAEKALRTCVHCGFCLPQCPTYTVLGDELDSPRGRIYLMKEMLEGGKPADASTVQHIDRCLSCLGCQAGCPSGVNYMHLVDHARVHIEETYERPLPDRLQRRLLGWLLPRPAMFGWALRLAKIAKPMADLLPRKLRDMVDMAPDGPIAAPLERNRTVAAQGDRRARVGLLMGCVQQAIGPEINDATIRVLTRHGCEVVILHEAYCCGAVTHHLGQESATLERVKANIAIWEGEIGRGGLDAIIINASGCGTMVKDYGFVLSGEADWTQRGARIAGLARDISEYLAELGVMPPEQPSGLRVTYQSPCSLQHGQKIARQPVNLLRAAGFQVNEPKEAHLCCGSAGTYNILQPEIAGKLRDRKLERLAATSPQVIASGNIGCMTQLRAGAGVPVVHTVELLDWATGGPRPRGL